MKEDPDKSEVLNNFLYVGNASSGREKAIEIMEYTHIINVSKDLPCYWDLNDDCNEWVQNQNIVVDDDNKFEDLKSIGADNDDGARTTKQKAFIKTR